MYGEDIDWAYRIKKAGYSIVYNPIVSTLHIKKQSGRSQENSIVKKQTQKYFYQTMAMFYEKHYVSKYPYVVSMLIKNVIQLRLLFLEIFNI